MNVQPKLSKPDERTMAAPVHSRVAEPEHRVPGGPRAFVTWPVEFEVEPWRP